MNFFILTSSNWLSFAEISFNFISISYISIGKRGCFIFMGHFTYKMGYLIYLKFCHLIFLIKKVWKENYCNTWPPIQIIMAGKEFLGFVLLPKILSNNQTARLLKVQYFKKELKYEVNFFMWIETAIEARNQLGLAWHGWACQKNLLNDKSVLNVFW